MKTPSKSTSPSLGDSLKSGFAAVVIPLEIVIAIVIYLYVLGDGSNFQGGDHANHPLPGNYLGIVYKGGPIVPMLLSLLMMVITFGIERYITISMAQGKGSTQSFIRKIKTLMESSNVDQALSECDKQAESGVRDDQSQRATGQGQNQILGEQ